MMEVDVWVSDPIAAFAPETPGNLYKLQEVYTNGV